MALSSIENSHGPSREVSAKWGGEKWTFAPCEDKEPSDGIPPPAPRLVPLVQHMFAASDVTPVPLIAKMVKMEPRAIEPLANPCGAKLAALRMPR